ncbi:DUF397 domain-containing protein [Streptosporangium sp. NPDC023825]|uniref:DUF397 domain-containing protein n=1 Tax=Streptosporangium sp. NPDC023825 TaxID=3154909 RepID=UPI00343F4826
MGDLDKTPATAEEIAGAEWRKSTHSTNDGACVEVAKLSGGRVALRDSQNRQAGVQTYSRSEWIAFVGGVQDGEFD